MSIRRSSDSLSRCDPSVYSNLYDVRGRAGVKRETVSLTPSLGKDTIEFSRDKLKEEALNRLRHTSKYVVAQSSFMRVGKYLFLATLFPPYFLLYGVPKWIVIEGVPFLFSLFVLGAKKLGEPVQAAAKKTMFFMQYMKEVARNVFVRPVVSVIEAIQRQVRRYVSRAAAFAREVLSQGVTKGAQLFRVPYGKVSEWGRSVYQEVNRWKEIGTKKVGEVISIVQEGVKQAPQQFLGWGQGQLKRMKEFALTRIDPWRGHFASSQQFATRGTDWVFRQFSFAGEKYRKNILEPLSAMYSKYIGLRYRKWEESLIKGWNRSFAFLEKKKGQMLAFLERRKKRLRELSARKWSLNLRLDYFPSFLQRWCRWCLNHPFVTGVIAGVVRVYSFVEQAVLSVGYFLMAGLSRIVAIVAALSETCRDFIHKAIDKIGQALIAGRKAIHKGALCGVYYFLLSCVMVGILFVLGGRLLSKTMHSVVKFSRA